MGLGVWFMVRDVIGLRIGGYLYFEGNICGEEDWESDIEFVVS